MAQGWISVEGHGEPECPYKPPQKYFCEDLGAIYSPYDLHVSGTRTILWRHRVDDS